MGNIAQYYIDQLGMERHPEGGWFAFIWRSGVLVPKNVLPDRYEGDRDTCSAIYYLLQSGEVSRWHQLRSAEIWAWHAGGTLLMDWGGTGDAPEQSVQKQIGPRLGQGDQFQVIVPAMEWQTTTISVGEFALVSCIVSPAFHDDDFYMPDLP